MSTARAKGAFWREVKYTEQEWIRKGQRSGLADHPRVLTSRQLRRLRHKHNKSDYNRWKSREANKAMLDYILDGSRA